MARATPGWGLHLGPAGTPPAQLLLHRPRVEEVGPGQEALICEADGQPWPCDHEQLLVQEPPEWVEP